ncbi:acetyl-CoA carboxylase biotin carboxylase subunit [Metabacillus halosaccharovorans]|uniref:acetyl-CoA carboxylase biotin carboxylase subunit n=1 Tax=Metabacillus halosaccharovorans TaxID=930124 RepID=UPI001C1F57D5|nr:acetyl-CoA carboxylase biotin carboxylase subunit [Metabacillus halosaccharovorans]MBU7593021.1 acetyl-CoA carboxylase biotin carboxylase subunit [Metabacillus halosaccharovorans]
MFKKILVANRGEIAVRVIRTCKKLDIKTVAIFSEADQDAPHVKLADEAYLVGAPRVTDSYLKIDKIIEIAKYSKVEAIHPGYGFLSENPQFAIRCQEEGLVFIGPSPEVISSMGSKIEARLTMERAGVPIVPGIQTSINNTDEAVAIANKIGYPIMLKASAGGGGIGMQVVRSDQDMIKAFEGNQKRAKSFFGNEEMYLEKYIERPRHIEVQILADSYGGIVYLGERECSVQRRHQKIVEEAPSPFLDDHLRRKMGEASIQAAKAIGYTNAGTIEYLVDENETFYFLEMNTRLQVEHPVTEETTGIDLVEQQLRIAAGEPLPFDQSDIKCIGHAIESRIYAEDPITFFPSPGKISKLSLPEGEGVRHELGVHEESIVSPFYDPMIAKLIVKGKSREEALAKLEIALSNYIVEGIKTNIPLLRKITTHTAFHKGETTTDFIDRHIKK